MNRYPLWKYIIIAITIGVVMMADLWVAKNRKHVLEWICIAGLALALLMVRVPHRVGAAMALLAMGMFLSLLNQAPADPYFMHNLQIWEQGRFIRFHGLIQWLGWVWPYAVVVYLLQHVWRADREN